MYDDDEWRHADRKYSGLYLEQSLKMYHLFSQTTWKHFWYTYQNFCTAECYFKHASRAIFKVYVRQGIRKKLREALTPLQLKRRSSQDGQHTYLIAEVGWRSSGPSSALTYSSELLLSAITTMQSEQRSCRYSVQCSTAVHTVFTTLACDMLYYGWLVNFLRFWRHCTDWLRCSTCPSPFFIPCVPGTYTKQDTAWQSLACSESGASPVIYTPQESTDRKAAWLCEGEKICWWVRRMYLLIAQGVPWKMCTCLAECPLSRSNVGTIRSLGAVLVSTEC